MKLHILCRKVLSIMLLVILPVIAPADSFWKQAGDYTYHDYDGSIWVKRYTGSGGDVIMPDTIADRPVTLILDSAFESCTNLTSVTIPDSVVLIRKAAFKSCSNLTSVTIPDSVSTIQDEVFQYCTSLTNVTIPDSVMDFGNYVFAYCSSLSGVTIPDGITSIPSRTFMSCSSLSSITIPDSVTSIGSYAFYNCTSLTNIWLPDAVTQIGYYAFRDCVNMTNMTLGTSLSCIYTGTFQGCTSLTSVTIPASVTRIERDAFRSCAGLTGVYFLGNAPSLESYVFHEINDATVYCLPGTAGWGATYGDLPTCRLFGIAQDASFGRQTNGFCFNVEGMTNSPFVIEVCSGLPSDSWSTLITTNLIDGAYAFSDPEWTNFSTRIYRARIQEFDEVND